MTSHLIQKRRDRSSTCPQPILNPKFPNHPPRSGLTLMELILSIALLSILAAASFGVLYWQAKTYYHIEQRTEAMQQLTNTYMVIYKEVKTWSHSPAAIDTTGNTILKRLHNTDFSYNPTTKILSWNGAPILKDSIASFTWNPSEQIVEGTLQKQVNRGGTPTNVAAIKFIIHPRNK